MIVDHARVIRDEPYRDRIRERLRALLRVPGVSLTDVLHEADRSCCRTQAWPLTAAHLLGPLLADIAGVDPENMVATMAEHEPAVVMARLAPSDRG